MLFWLLRLVSTDMQLNYMEMCFTSSMLLSILKIAHLIISLLGKNKSEQGGSGIYQSDHNLSLVIWALFPFCATCFLSFTTWVSSRWQCLHYYALYFLSKLLVVDWNFLQVESWDLGRQIFWTLFYVLNFFELFSCTEYFYVNFNVHS